MNTKLFNSTKKINILSVIIVMFFSLHALAQDALCDSSLPDNSVCEPPNIFDYESINDGNWNSETTWLNGNVPSTSYSEKVKIIHNVNVSNSNLKLESNAILYVSGENSSLTLNNGNLIIEGNGSKAIFEDTILRTSGNTEQKENTFLCMNNIELSIGEEEIGFDFVAGESSTSANFKNDGGYRWLEYVCGNVTSNYQNLGDDIIINSSIDIGDRGTADKEIDGQDSGDFQNEKGSMIIINSEFNIPNGNFQNLVSLQACDARFNLKNGNIQNIGQIVGENIVLWNRQGDIQNDGSWNGSSIIAWLNESGNNPEGINGLPNSTDLDTIASFFIGCQESPLLCDEDAFAGTGTLDTAVVLVDPDIDTLITVTTNGDAVIPEGYVLATILTTGPDFTIIAVSNTTTILLPAVNGNHTIHLLAYNPETLDLGDIILGSTTNADILNLISSGTVCADLEEVGIPILVVVTGSPTKFDLNTNHNELDIKLYPNPVVNNLNIKLQLLNKEIMNYKIFDLNGRQILSSSFDNSLFGKTQVNTSTLSNGLYIIKFDSKYRSFSKKVQVNH